MGAGPALAVSLEEAVRSALRNNPDVLISRDDERIAEQDVRQARAGYYPSIDFRGASGVERTDSVTTRARAGLNGSGETTLWRSESGLSLRQLLFDGFFTSSDVERSTSRFQAASERVRVSASTVAVSAIEAYLEILRNRELVRVAQENVRGHQEIVQRARSRAGVSTTGAAPTSGPAVGRGDAAELPRAEARLAGARAALEQARGRLRDAEAGYTRVVGEPPKELAATLQPGNLPESDVLALEQALVRSPGLRAANKDLDAATSEVRQAESRFWPRLDLELGGTRNNNLDGVRGADNDASALLVLRYNLYQGGADVARRRGALERVSRARNTLYQTRVNLEQETRLSWNALATARDRLPILQEQLRRSLAARDAYRQQYEVGRRNLIDLLDAEADYWNAVANVVTGELTVRFGEFRLLAAVWELFTQLGISDPDIAPSMPASNQQLR
ncbi:MAG: TolC family outer membrane protein [Proteobacteria bacterium]|nr:TolC family outer membrane protein [Pseudomonadota bacterium]